MVGSSARAKGASLSITMNLQATALIPNECAHAQADQFQTASAIANRQPFADDDARPRAGRNDFIRPAERPSERRSRDVREPPGFMSGSRRKLRGEADGSVKLTRPMRVQLNSVNAIVDAPILCADCEERTPEQPASHCEVPRGALRSRRPRWDYALLITAVAAAAAAPLVRIRFAKLFIQRASFCLGVWR